MRKEMETGERRWKEKESRWSYMFLPKCFRNTWKTGQIRRETGMKTPGACILLCLLALSLSPADWFPWVVNGQELESATGEVSTDSLISTSVQSDSETTTASSDCREEKFPCTRLYSVHKPVKQCISYLCVTSVRRMYIINKEVCSRIVCKENEVMQDEICRQLAGLPSRRLRRSGQPLHLPCRQLLEQQRRSPNAL
ncbi:microfibrillar-associated protein 5 isoform X2 [Grus americana]|uniref:microfibrillar-associated protein 5 isoform X2 n=1 Tax=Grus americana TaxID=9117 RepID=UPI002407B1E2|nr:microfibrillar-associated protein 5 isoform X2 [Grus americana]